MVIKAILDKKRFEYNTESLTARTTTPSGILCGETKLDKHPSIGELSTILEKPDLVLWVDLPNNTKCFYDVANKRIRLIKYDVILKEESFNQQLSIAQIIQYMNKLNKLNN